MSRTIVRTNAFKKDVKRLKKQGKKLNELLIHYSSKALPSVLATTRAVRPLQRTREKGEVSGRIITKAKLATSPQRPREPRLPPPQSPKANRKQPLLPKFRPLAKVYT